MSPDLIAKWEHILEDVEKNKIPIQFIKKMILKLDGKKQHTINVERLLLQGLEPEHLEDVVSKKLHELEESIISIEFILNVKSIAETVQPTTDKLLNKI